MECSKRNRQYLQICIRSEVRVKNIEDIKTKCYEPNWSKEVYTITFVKDNDYMVKDGTRNVYQRFELLKIVR